MIVGHMREHGGMALTKPRPFIIIEKPMQLRRPANVFSNSELKVYKWTIFQRDKRQNKRHQQPIGKRKNH